ncbi:unnamed protein product [Gongylonema pulchrum]|uniref:CPG4 domain-containing protein n=1 Tax=Gongylonema pulchrum TaxID=637853 RepID=A0A183CXH9_9BILA|nr:unnamed protein product [Gongylonema pulchrum]
MPPQSGPSNFSDEISWRKELGKLVNFPRLKTIEMPQCKCKEFDQCSAQMRMLAEKCKLNQTCVGYLKKVADVDKILQCHDKEQQRADEVTNCVKQKNEQVACAKEGEVPKNISLQNTFYPVGIVQYSMCIGECLNYEMDLLYPAHPQEGISCELKLGCLLEQPTREAEAALVKCQSDLHNDATTRFMDTCKCLQEAGVDVDCAKANVLFFK